MFAVCSSFYSVIVGPAKRVSCNFHPDDAVDLRLQSKLSDFQGTEWVRGHLAPAADSKHCQVSSLYKNKSKKMNNAGYNANKLNVTFSLPAANVESSCTSFTFAHLTA